ncbi:MAG: hypothetical protein A2X95_10230 [Syntrophobacterales bacterium GWF2_56_9]|nr:MAG: hypothetical protein A2X95_10230 [Syntrophobacterales bacterium GWF2_56_9]
MSGAFRNLMELFRMMPSMFRFLELPDFRLGTGLGRIQSYHASTHHAALHHSATHARHFGLN